MSTVTRKRASAKVPLRGTRETRDRTEFSPKVFDALVQDMQDGTIPLKRITVSDTEHSGLRAIIRDTGLVSFHVHYEIDDSRPFLKIGNHPEMTVADARKIARAVQSLAEKGIDPTEGLHKRLIRELLEKGDKWRP